MATPLPQGTKSINAGKWADYTAGSKRYHTGMVKVYGARDLAEAQFVKGLLEAEEIETVIQGGPLNAVVGEIPMPEASPTLWVKETDLDRARTIVEEIPKGGPAALDPKPTWTCPKCGEVLEGQFSECWNCGTARPEQPAENA